MKKRKKVIRRSGFEDKIEAQLKKAKTKYKYEPFALEYIIPERKARYTPDFEIVRNGIILEAKGKLDSETRKKMLLVIEQNPKQDIRMIFMRNNYIRKGSKTTYAMWAEKNNIKYAIGEVPVEWLQTQKAG